VLDHQLAFHVNQTPLAGPPTPPRR
jgi:hypothetical protein